MASPAPTPAALLARLVAADPGRPRITVYDDTEGPTRGERVELSARVLANWVAKAGNLLQDELDAGPGTVVRLDLPPHWRTLYWAFAAWSVGACVEVADDDEEEPGPVDVVVTTDPARAGGAEHVVLVTLAALARRAVLDLPPGALDEAHDLATHGDVLAPWDEADPGDPGLRTGDVEVSFADLVPAGVRPGRVHTTTTSTAELLRLALAVWAADGSLVLTRGTPQPDALAARLASEGVTDEA